MGRKKRVYTGLFVFVAAMVAVEFFLKTYWGFCDAVLVREDPDYEYIAQPSQDRYRFRKHIRYNSLSMRSGEVDSTAVIFLGFGDSILNGGTLTDQDSLATTILSDSLSVLLGKKVQFLNISAGSWGPDNCYAFLAKHGDFGSEDIFLFVSSHDAYDNMAFEKIVGINESFPAHQYKLAIVELFDRYLIPRLTSGGSKGGNVDALGINKRKKTSVFNSGFESFLAYSKTHNKNLVVFLHATLPELKQKKYNIQGKEIIEFCVANGVPLIEELNHNLTALDYRDDLHLSESGQKKIASIVFEFIENQLKLSGNNVLRY